MDLIHQIARIPLFQGLERRQYEDLAMILIDQVFKRGEDIFYEDDEATGFYTLISGRVKIFKLSAEGKEQILHIFGPGEPFGEVAVFFRSTFSSSCPSSGGEQRGSGQIGGPSSLFSLKGEGGSPGIDGNFSGRKETSLKNDKLPDYFTNQAHRGYIRKIGNVAA